MENDSAMNAVRRHEVWVVVGLILSLTVLVLTTHVANAQERVVSYTTIKVIEMPLIEMDIEDQYIRVENNSGISFSMIGENSSRDTRTPFCIGCSKRQYSVNMPRPAYGGDRVVNVQVMY